MFAVQGIIFVFAVGLIDTTLANNVLGVIGGKEIEPEDAPYMAYIKIYNEDKVQTCGGSIINEKFVLTAAHCIPESTEKAVVIFGSKKPNYYQHTSALAIKFICHENYNSTSKLNDICILKLYGPLAFDARVQKVGLPIQNTEYSKTTLANVTGWGCEKENSIVGSMNSALHQVLVPVTASEACSVDSREIVPDTMLCGGVNGWVDTCTGDDGGPVVENNVQIGIVSYKAVNPIYPRVAISRYTKVSKYTDWIQNVIEENS